MSSGQSSHTPRDAKVMAAILKDVGVEDYEPRIINQMLEFAYRYVTDVLDDARIYSEFAAKKSVDADDVRLAVQMKVENALTNPPSRELISELAQEKNSIPLPALKQQYGLRLPPDRYCTLQPNFRLKPQPVPASAAPITIRSGSISSIAATAPVGPFRMVGQQQRPKPTATPPGMQKPTRPIAQPSGQEQPLISAATVAKPTGPTATLPSKPLFRLVSGSTAASARPSPATTATTSQSETSATTATAGVKRKFEPSDDDQM